MITNVQLGYYELQCCNRVNMPLLLDFPLGLYVHFYLASSDLIQQ